MADVIFFATIDTHKSKKKKNITFATNHYMKTKLAFFLFVSSCILLVASCQKSADAAPDQGTSDPSAHTVANISGTYALKGLTWNFAGAVTNVYDLLDDCEKDDVFKFNTDMSLVRTDAGTICSPPGNDTGTWLLRNDSIYLGQSTSGGKIKSFDGKTLVLTGAPPSDPGVVATTTFVKK